MIIGWQLGTDPHVQVATYFNNHLTNGIYKYFADAGRFADAAAFFRPLADRDPEVAALVARACIENGILSNSFQDAIDCW